MITKIQKTAVIEDNRTHESDTGSPEGVSTSSPSI